MEGLPKSNSKEGQKEEERKERQGRAKQMEEGWIKERKQRKITEILNQLPENKAEMIRREEARERRLLLKETKEELWRRWRQRKGRGIEGWNPEKYDSKEAEHREIDKKLERAEKELKLHREEAEKKKLEEDEKNRRLETKKRKEKKWEMMRWLTNFLEKNKEDWDLLKLRNKNNLKDEEEDRNQPLVKKNEEEKEINDEEVKNETSEK